MKTKEIINQKNQVSQGVQFKVVGDWVYRKTNNDKRFSSFQKLDLFIANFETENKELNCRENSRFVFEFLENLGIKCEHTSLYGSKYYLINGKSVRVSNHGFTTDKYSECDYNFFSYEKNGYIQIIESIKELI